MSETLQEHATAFVDAPNRPAPGGVRPDSRIRPARMVKIGLACTLLLGAAGAVLSSQGHVTADNAVVSAYVLSIRSPIQGQVSGLQLHVGDTVNGTGPEAPFLAHVFNDRVSDEHLVDLRSELARDRAERAAFESQRQELLSLRTTLTARSEAYRAAQTAYTAASSNEAVAQLQERALHLQLARRDMGRKVSLGRSGDASVADVDRVTLEARTAEADVAAQSAHLAYLRAREAAAKEGVFLDTGSNDVSYSAQRIDEIDLRLADIGRTIAGLTAQEGATEARLAAEELRFANLSSAELRLPAHGMVWKLGASSGERIGTGDTLAQVIDCGASFIVASIPQRQFSSVQVGKLARFRLSGETIDREGRVLSVTGDASVSGDRNLAAVPAVDRAPSAVVRIAVPPSGNNGAACLVGRTARVLLPAAGGGVLTRLLRWLP